MYRLIASVLLVLALTGCERTPDAAYYENSAKHWLDGMKFNYVGVACSAHDSDNDGYVTCAVNVSPGVPMQTLLCDGKGCKPGKDLTAVPAAPVPVPPPVSSPR